MAGRRKEDIPIEKEFDYVHMTFNTIEDYDKYNEWARTKGRPAKAPTEDFYKKHKVRFNRFDQPTNVLKARVRNRVIDWKGQLKPGCTYYLCEPVIRFLNGLATPIFEEVPIESGGKKTETKQVGEQSRFSCQIMEFA